jgi:uncharacterized protein YndB with AHSA1/START domain
MPETYAIHHRVEVEASPEALFDALSTQDGLACWWTPMVETEATVGSIIKFRFGDGKGGADMRIDELVPGKRVAWTCVEGPWPEMRFVFSIEAHERGAVLLFDHEGWPEVGDFYRHCNTKWGYFLASSLKPYLESGTGAPHPQDPSI